MINDEWHICIKCKKSTVHEPIYVKSIDRVVKEVQFKCTHCGAMHWVIKSS